MVSNVPDACKQVLPYLQRAAELDAREPVVAYYCRYHALKSAFAKRNAQNKAELDPFLTSLMSAVEQAKQSHKDQPAIADEKVGREYLRNFALKIFLKADNEDRSSSATSKTARVFLAAVVFLEVLAVFGDVESDLSEKIRYAKWRAAEILRAEKEGRAPAPPPDAAQNDNGGGFDLTESSLSSHPSQFSGATEGGSGSPRLPADTSSPSFSSSSSSSFGGVSSANPFASHPAAASGNPYASQPQLPPRALQPQPQQQQQQQQSQQSFAAPQYQQHYQSDDVVVQPTYDPQLIALAQKNARHAISALQFDDLDTALGLLQQAMDNLNTARKKHRH